MVREGAYDKGMTMPRKTSSVNLICLNGHVHRVRIEKWDATHDSPAETNLSAEDCPTCHADWKKTDE